MCSKNGHYCGQNMDKDIRFKKVEIRNFFQTFFKYWKKSKKPFCDYAQNGL